MTKKLTGLSEVENLVSDAEKGLNLYKLHFEVYERALKRHGYLIDITDDCWASIELETNI